MTSKKIQESILKNILTRFRRTTGTIERFEGFDPYIHIHTDHGKADQIGQYALRNFPRVKTYFCCHVFRRATVKIWFK